MGIYRCRKTGLYDKLSGLSQISQTLAIILDLQAAAIKDAKNKLVQGQASNHGGRPFYSEKKTSPFRSTEAMNIDETLRAAVTTKKPCKISKPSERERKVCPYIIGRSKDGETNVLYYQYDGYSSRGLKEPGSSANWRCNRVSEISSAQLIDEPWCGPIQKPKTRGNCVASIEAEVDGYY